jgi:hypothetical protein
MDVAYFDDDVDDGVAVFEALDAGLEVGAGHGVSPDRCSRPGGGRLLRGGRPAS